ncbi:MAG TPA: hypothetical protein VF702_13335 [Allosphingosinicella sp.]|jgi:predicted O-methyltransferase YrrM
MADDPNDSPSLLWTRVGAAEPGKSDDDIRRNFSVLEFSQEAAFVTAATEILRRDLGYVRSLRAQQSMLADGRPMPMMSYGLVEYLMSLDFSASAVLELGGGQSTLFWAARAQSVRTIEHDADWLSRISRSNLGNVSIVEVRQDGYVGALSALEERFDIIVIDCAANRFECARAAGPLLREGGMIILDNSDWHPRTAAYLRSLDLIQLDYPDFRPLHHFRCTTSIFLHPDFRPVPAGPRLPPVPRGGKDIGPVNDWDVPARG